MKKKAELIEDAIFVSRVVKQQEDILEAIADATDNDALAELIASVITELDEARRMLEADLEGQNKADNVRVSHRDDVL